MINKITLMCIKTDGFIREGNIYNCNYSGNTFDYYQIYDNDHNNNIRYSYHPKSCLITLEEYRERQINLLLE